MGTDIHLMAQRRTSGKWTTIFPSPEFRVPWLIKQSTQQPLGQYYQEAHKREWCFDRNYALFSVLADVRNGHGFAGVTTYEPLTPISRPRGLPTDFSLEDAKCVIDPLDDDTFWLGDHSHSWLLLAELMAYDWNKPMTQTGVVSLEEFTDRIIKFGPDIPLKGEDVPYEGWSGLITGPKIRTVNAAAAIQALQGNSLRQAIDEEVYVQDIWQTPLKIRVADFVGRVIPGLQEHGSPDEIRIVFGFDS